jgi:hypothetical protein
MIYALHCRCLDLFLVFTQAEYASRLHGGRDGWAQCKWHNRRRVLVTLSSLEHVPLSQTPSNWLIFMLTWSGTHINSNDSPPGNNQQEKRNHISPLMLPLFHTYTTQTQTLNPSSNTQECFVHGADGSLGGCLMQNGLFAPSLPPIEVNY